MGKTALSLNFYQAFALLFFQQAVGASCGVIGLGFPFDYGYVDADQHG